MASFKNILIPIDKIMDHDMAIDKALRFGDDTSIKHIYFVFLIKKNRWVHLFFKSLMSKKINFAKATPEIDLFLNELETKVMLQNQQAIITKKVVVSSRPSKDLAAYAIFRKIDLIVFLRVKDKHIIADIPKINIGLLAQLVPCPTLVVSSAITNQNIGSIVLPVRYTIPEKKMQVALDFARKYNSKIHLVIILDNNDAHVKTKIDAFFSTYLLLKESGHSPNYKALIGRDSADLLLHYSHQVKADMILLNPGKETTVNGFTKQGIAQILHPFPKLQVLMLNPNP